MKCVCGATVPITSSSSLCTSCLRRGSAEEMFEGSDFEQYRGDDGDDPMHDPFAGLDPLDY